jgi:uroporphyrinogen-III synthase
VKPLIVIRPEPGASRTAARAMAMGLDVRLVPLFTVVPVDWTAPDPAAFDALILTSANAVRHGGEELHRLKGLPVHAVGDATASLARAAGFELATVGMEGSRQMRLPPEERLLHLAGRDHLPIGAARTIIVYESRAREQPDDIAGLVDCVVAVHSPRAGRRLAELVDQRSRIMIAAISPAAAEACEAGWKRVHAAPQPTDAALLALAARLCESPAG